ncbi:MAG: hypothetical protein HP496_13775 [Nitrospira sp.]|nr:hypothetical protein [Nitrospira sp.]
MPLINHEAEQPVGRTPLYARQASAFSGFHYTICNATGEILGEVIWPSMAQAKNARIRWHGSHSSKGAVEIHWGAQRYDVQFEYLDRGWVNDVRFTLEHGRKTIAVADMRFARRLFARGRVSFVEPFTGTLLRDKGWFRRRYSVENDSGVIGFLEDRAAIMAVREMTIDLPDTLDIPTKMFVFFLAAHLTQAQA